MTTTPEPDARDDARPPGPARRRELAEQTLDRFRDAAVADPDARRLLVAEVVRTHLWLADAIARRYRDRGEDLDDLRQVARTGLFHACLRFNPSQGSFAGFASITVAGVVKRHFRDHTWSVRPPRPTQELSVQLWQRWPAIAQSVGGEPTDHQLSTALGASLEEVRQAQGAKQAYSCGSLEALARHPLAEEVDSSRVEARLIIESVWDQLEEAEQHLLRRRFVEDLSQTEIAAELSVSQMHVSRLLKRLMAKLRHLIGSLDQPGVEAA